MVDIFDRTLCKLENYLYNRDNIFFWVNDIGIHNAELEFARSSDEKRDLYRELLVNCLVRSYEPDDIQCAIAMLQDELLRANTSKHKKKVMNLLAMGYYRLGNYSKSIDLLGPCSEIDDIFGILCNPKILCRLIVERNRKEVRNAYFIGSATIVGLVTGLIGSSVLILSPTWVMEAVEYAFTKDHVKKVVIDALPETTCNPLQVKDEMYLLAYRYFIRAKSRDLSRSNYLLDRCLEIAPEWEPAITLKKRIKPARVKAFIGERIVDGILIAAGGFYCMTLLSWAKEE